ncbi:MAG: efflux RND transporter periplasmic adaptor subunit [Marinibacterium sp.]
MKFLRQSLVGLFLASLTLGLLVYAGQMVMGAVRAKMAEESHTPTPRERIFAVNVVTATPGTVTPVLQAFGQVQSRRTLELRAPASGRIVSLSNAFVEGGTVSAGDVLLELDPADAEAALDRAKSDLLDAEAEVRDADRGLDLARDELAAAREQADLRQRAYERQKNLNERGVGTAAAVEVAELAAAQARQAVLGSRMALTQAEARIDQAATRLARARIALRTAQRDLADTRLVATFAGTLGDVTLVEGRLVQANEKLAKLIDPGALEVAFRVSTAQYVRLLDDAGGLLHAPVKVSLNVAGIDLTARGRISRDSAAVGEGLSGRLIFARLDTAPGFKPGDFVTVEVEEPALDAVVRLPASALDSASTVLVLGDEDRLEELPVTLMRRQGDDVLVHGDALAGREVVTGRTPLLGAGIKVRPLRPEAQAEASAGPSMVRLTDARRARLVTFVTENSRMPADVKARLLGQLEQEEVPEPMVQRLESRMGG